MVILNLMVTGPGGNLCKARTSSLIDFDAEDSSSIVSAQASIEVPEYGISGVHDLPSGDVMLPESGRTMHTLTARGESLRNSNSKVFESSWLSWVATVTGTRLSRGGGVFTLVQAAMSADVRIAMPRPLFTN